MNEINPFSDIGDYDETEQSNGELNSDSTVPSDAEEKPHQITIKQLMVITLMCAAAIVLIKGFYVFGTLTLFCVFAVATFALIASKLPRPTCQFFNEVFWGLLMPVACVITDPIVFQNADFDVAPADWMGAVESWEWAVYSLMGWTIVNLVASWFLAGQNSAIGAWFSGTFIVATVLAYTIGVCILPLTLVGLVVMIGVLGFTPFFTGYVFWVAFKRNWKRFPLDPITPFADKSRWAWLLVGICVSLLIPVTVYFSIGLAGV